MRLIAPFQILLAAFCALSVASAQRAEEASARQQSPRQEVVNQFESSGLKAGKAFPEVDIYDADGNPFNTRSLKGRHTVIVNGCLT
jgi:cytochrome oxidase Cu insertion factor (SCO1/SenC/PrrC family)